MRQPKLRKLAEETIKQNRFADALICAGEGLKLDHAFAPATVTLLYIKTMALFGLGRNDEAIDTWRLILQKHLPHFPEQYQWKYLSAYLPFIASEIVHALLSYEQKLLNYRISLNPGKGQNGENFWFFESQLHYSKEAVEVPAEVISSALRLTFPESLPFTLECYYLSSGDGGETRELLYTKEVQ
ncbi:MAG: hypothetical protein AMXMBFR48_28980 [Ignavibacteriales bacterium]